MLSEREELELLRLRKQKALAQQREVSGEGSWLGDVSRSFAQGVVGAGKSLVDVFGAETAPSQYLEGVQQQLQQGLTPERQAEIQRRKQLEEEASKSGNLLNEIGTFLGGVAEAPVQSLAQGLGSVVPFIGTGVVGSVAKLGAPAVRALNTVVGVQLCGRSTPLSVRRWGLVQLKALSMTT